MKKLLFVIASLLVLQLSWAQPCFNPGTAVCGGTVLTQPGFGPPDSIPPFINAQTVTTVIPFKNFDSVMIFSQMVTVNSLRFDSIGNLPAGLCWATNKVDNTYSQGEAGCFSISGTTCALPGQYELQMLVTVNSNYWAYSSQINLRLFLRVDNLGEAAIVVDTTQTYANAIIPYGPTAPCVPPVFVSLGNDQSVCLRSTFNLFPQVISGLPPYSYAWSVLGDSINCNNCQNPWAYPITQSTTFTVTVTDANSSTATASVTYTPHALPTVTISLTDTVIDCAHPLDTATAVITNVTGHYYIEWGWGGTAIWDSLPRTFTRVFTQADGYGAYITISDSLGCTSYSGDSIIFKGISNSLSQTSEPECYQATNGQIAVNAQGGTGPYSYIWSNGTTADPAVHLTSGAYSVTITDASSCTAAFNYYLYGGNGPYVYVGSNGVNCSGVDTVFCNIYNGTPPYTFIWSNGATTPELYNVTGQLYSVTVSDAAGCTSWGQDSLYACYSTISGSAFIDLNGNCVFDAGEIAVNSDVVTATKNGIAYYGYTDVNGYYLIYVPDTGTYTLNIAIYGSCSNTVLCGGQNQTVTLTTPGTSSVNNNMALQEVPGINLGIHPGWTSANPGSMKSYWMYYYNHSGTYTGAVTLTFQYDANLVYVNADMPYTTHDAVNHIMTWVIPNFTNGSWDYLGQVYFSVPASLSLGYQLQSDFRIDPFAGDCDTTDNQYHFSEVVTGSHDPNSKTVQPAGNITSDDSVLTYAIHFQNTGTAQASRVVVKDVLSSNLDPSTVRNISSSHTYSSFTITDQGTLIWTFDPISLPDSTMNERESNGYIIFTVKQKKNLTVGTSINNIASIYFDQNLPVLTNTVNNTVVSATGITEVRGSNSITVNVYPNPFSSATNIVVQGINEKYDFDLFDVTGRVQRKILSIQTSQFELSRDNLAAGVYFYRISINAHQKAFGKLVIQ